MIEGCDFLKASLSETTVISMSSDTEPVNDHSKSEVDEAQAVASSLSDSNMAGDPPPDGGYGWVCVASVFISSGFTWGVIAVRSSAESTRTSMHAQPLL